MMSEGLPLGGIIRKVLCLRAGLTPRRKLTLRYHLFVDMELVQDAMGDWRKNDAHQGDKDDATE
jgi:hypothetical protein